MMEILAWMLWGVGCYFLGRISMMHTIIRAVVEEAENESPIKGDGEPGVLKIEKINNIYYAYVGPDFAGQSANIDELISNMKADKRFAKFKVSGIEGLSQEEQTALAQAISKNYHLK